MKTLTERTTAALAWLDAQLAICNAANKGQWTPQKWIENPGVAEGYNVISGNILVVYNMHGACCKSDADFIAAARTGYPAMLEEWKATIEYIQRNEPWFGGHNCSLDDLLEQILTSIEQLQ